MGVRVRQRHVPRHRRHRRGDPGAPARRPPGSRTAGRRRAARRPLDARHAVLGRRLGRVRRRQHPGPLPADPVLRLRRGHRPAVRRRDRARRRDARGRGAVRRGRGAARARAGSRATRNPTARGSARWGANHVYGTGAVVPAAVAAGVPTDDGRIRRAVRLAAPAIRTRTAGGARTCARTGSRAWIGRGSEHRVADGLGPARPDRGRRAGGAAPRRAASSGWRARNSPRGRGTSPSTPGPGSPATSSSTITCTGWSSRCRRWAGSSMDGRQVSAGDGRRRADRAGAARDRAGGAAPRPPGGERHPDRHGARTLAGLRRAAARRGVAGGGRRLLRRPGPGDRARRRRRRDRGPRAGRAVHRLLGRAAGGGPAPDGRRARCTTGR